MIINKNWATISKNKYTGETHRFTYSGYLLFGLIPIYIRKIDIDIPRVD